jgi:hypothetical protein
MPKKGQGIKVVPKTKPRANINKQPKAVSTKLPGVFSLAKSSWQILWHNRSSMSFIILIYGLVYLVLVLGISSPGNVPSLRHEFSGVFHGHLSSLFSGLSIYTYLVGSSTSSPSASGSTYQVFIMLIASLAIIWALRQYYLGAKVRARDSYYKGLYPFVPFLLVLLFIILELIPFLIGLFLYGTLINGGIAVTGLEQVLSLIPIIGLVFISFYLLASSLMALYIVTLPNMTPMKAIKSARGLVKGRRGSVLKKMVFLPVVLIIITGLIMLPFIYILPSIAAWVFYLLSLAGLVYIHSYLYALYRGLINE